MNALCYLCNFSVNLKVFQGKNVIKGERQKITLMVSEILYILGHGIKQLPCTLPFSFISIQY